MMEDAFAHHVWATLRLVDTCLALSPQQLETTVPGTYGSILDTLRHCIGSDAWDLFVATGDRASLIDEDDMHLSELRAAMERHGPAWSRLLAQDLDPDVVLNEVDEDDGYERNVAMGRTPQMIAPASSSSANRQGREFGIVMMAGSRIPEIRSRG